MKANSSWMVWLVTQTVRAKCAVIYIIVCVYLFKLSVCECVCFICASERFASQKLKCVFYFCI